VTKKQKRGAPKELKKNWERDIAQSLEEKRAGS
jgi:hypothetical protein